MVEQSTTLHEKGSNSAQITGEATPSSDEAVMKELVELRKVNQKLNANIYM